MLRDSITKEIGRAMKERNNSLLYVLKMIKSEFLKFRTSRGFSEDNFTDEKEISILQKLHRTWVEERDMFVNAERDVTEMNERIEVLEQFIPNEPSDDNIKNMILNSGIEINVKNTKMIIEYVKNIYPGAQNGKIARIIRNIQLENI